MRLRGGMSPVWISKPPVSRIAMSLLVFFYCIGAFVCRYHCFNPSLCHLLSFLLSCPVAVARPCRLSEFYPNKASVMCFWISINCGKLPTYPSPTNPTNPTFCLQWDISVSLWFRGGVGGMLERGQVPVVLMSDSTIHCILNHKIQWIGINRETNNALFRHWIHVEIILSSG